MADAEATRSQNSRKVATLPNLFVRDRTANWGEYYPSREDHDRDRQKLLTVANALTISRHSIGMEQNGRLQLFGKAGTIKTRDEGRYALYLGMHSAQAFRAAKELLTPTLKLVLDCSEEGLFLFDINPIVQAKAASIRRLGGFRAALSEQAALERSERMRVRGFGKQGRAPQE